MPLLPAHLGEPKPLAWWTKNLDQFPPSGWLYIRKSIQQISLVIECFPGELDPRDVSEEDFSEFEAALKVAGFKGFLCDVQLSEIIGNLEEQRPNYSSTDLEQAIDFYWRRDAFIALPGEVA